ncbi:MAG: M20 metallopeptidase family protein [Planctomycetota bacterium]|jgi:hippurate hydrolase
MNDHPLDALVTPHLERLVAFRHDLHRHPELRYQEERTAGKVEEALHGSGYSTRRMAGTGVVADTGEGPAVALRGDMDALPLQELNEFEHRSTIDGRMHACGHDGHTTILLGTALVLAAARERLQGNVRFLFQPAEEGGGGAAKMRDEGALEGVDRVFGIHNWPRIPLGKVGVRSGPMMAAAALFKVRVIGKGGHGSQPQDAKDPVLAAAQIVTLAQSLVARESHPLHPAVLSVCTIHGGTATNIIPDDVEFSGTIRTLDDDQADMLGRRLKELAEGVASASGLSIEYEYERYYPVTRNHDEETTLVKEIAGEVFGEDAVTDEGLPTMGAEDFSFFLQQRPGAYWFLGGGGDGRTNSMCHSSDYDFNDDLILPGVRMYLRLVERTTGSTLV